MRPVCFRVAKEVVIHKKKEKKSLRGCADLDCAGKTALVSTNRQVEPFLTSCGTHGKLYCPVLTRIFHAPEAAGTSGGYFEA